VGEIWEMTSDPHPPGYYLLLHAALRFGTSETTVRLPSAIVSVVSVGLLFVLGRRLVNRQVAWLAATLLAVSPLEIWYAQEARMYACVGAAALLAAVGATMPRWPGVVVLATGLTLGLYLDYVMLPLWVALGAAWVILCWKRARGPASLDVWLLGSMIAGFAASPLWAHLHVSLSQQVAGSYITEDVRRFVDLRALSSSTYVFLLAGLSVLAAASTVGLGLLSRRFPDATAAVCISALIAVTMFVPLPRLYTLKKFAVTGWPFVVLVAAWLADQTPRWRSQLTRWAVAASLVAAVVSAVGVHKDDWRALVAYVNAEVPADEQVWLDPPWDSMAYNHYNPRTPPISSQPDASLSQLLDSRQTLWLVVQRRFGAAIPGSPSEEWLDRNAGLTRRVSFDRLELRRYALR
jgi:uncharacterized membrane protein